jgi:hypothetical protein
MPILDPDMESQARKMVRECGTGQIICHHAESGRVYYRDVDSTHFVQTDYTREHIEIAWHRLPAGDPDIINFDRVNTQGSASEYQCYTKKVI